MHIAAPSGDDAAGDGGIEAERIADNQYPIADPRGVAVAPADIRHRMVEVDLEQRQIGLGVASDDPGGMRLSVLQNDRYFFGIVDDVVLGDDVAVGIDDETRAGRYDRQLRHAEKPS